MRATDTRDFLPFGEELFADGQSRTTASSYSQTGQDGVRKRFTGYEKDMETGLDFAEARMYENRYGRFTAIDPLLASGKSANPQTFNRYVYVLNNPLVLTDHFGLQVGDWYTPVTPNGDVDPSRSYAYILRGFSTDGYQIVSSRNQRGELIGSGVGLDNNHVVRFNPNGPEPRNVASILLSQILSDYAYQGWDTIASDAYENSSIEHPADGYVRGSELAINPLEIASFGAGSGVSVVGKKAMERSITKVAGAESETFFRTMTKEAATIFEQTGRMPSGSETMVTKSLAEAQKYRGVTMQIETTAGTTERLSQIGVRNAAASHPFPNMPLVQNPWMGTKAFFKMENKTLNIGLGNGEALDIFNCSIIGCGRVK